MAGRPSKKQRNYDILTADQGKGINRRDIDAIRELSSMPLIDLNNPQALMARFQEYLNFCYDEDINLGYLGAYNALGVNKKEIERWLNGKRTPAHKALAEYVNRVVASYLELKMSNGQIMPVTGIWWQKNFEGFDDKPNKPIEENNQLEGIRTPEQIAAALPSSSDDKSK